ncbi:MAG: DNA cytosine methyltransferase [Thermomicrobiales bacterium]|nr:DNA cytosine methyltransferase [Thermomicrobiales bacterium]
MDALPDGPIDVEIFSCAGGMAEGFRRAGITFHMAVDMAKDHCDSYERNLGHRPVQMDARDLLRMARLGWRVPVRLLVADPPCTPWSRAGKRQGVSDDRDMLRQTAEIIGLLRPRAYLIGNVPGLEDANNLAVVQDVIGGLARWGYCVSDFAALDAADYGVPQHRVRPFWFGHRHGPCLRWPLPTHGDPCDIKDTLPGLPMPAPWVTCGQALGHLSPRELGRMVWLRKRPAAPASALRASVPERPARTVCASSLGDGNVINYSRKHAPSAGNQPAKTVRTGGRGGHQAVVLENTNDSDPGQPAKTIVAARRGTQAMTLHDTPNHPPAMAFGGRDGGVDRTHQQNKPARAITTQTGDHGVLVLAIEGARRRVPQSERVVATDGPATTLQAREDRQGTGMVMEWPWARPSTAIMADPRLGQPGHKDKAWKGKGGQRARAKQRGVLLSERAGAILQGFPETWVFSGVTKKTRWSQIGQAMPPPLAHAVAQSIVAQLAATVDDGPPENYVGWVPPVARTESEAREQLVLVGGSP